MIDGYESIEIVQKIKLNNWISIYFEVKKASYGYFLFINFFKVKKQARTRMHMSLKAGTLEKLIKYLQIVDPNILQMDYEEIIPDLTSYKGNQFKIHKTQNEFSYVLRLSKIATKKNDEEYEKEVLDIPTEKWSEFLTALRISSDYMSTHNMGD